MSPLDDRIAALSPEKRRLLERRLTARPPAEQPRNGPFSLLSEEDFRKLPPDVEDAFSLSQLQLGMLYHMEMSAGSATLAYHNVYSWTMRAPFYPDLLRRVLQESLPGYPFLRTSFDLTSYSEPLQLVHRDVVFPMVTGDWRGLSELEQQERIAVLADAEARRPFDLGRPPLWRLHLHRLTEETFQFTLTELHAISDGWSLTKTLGELFSRYFALQRNEPSLVTSTPALSYRDFVRLEREAMESEECRAFWDRVVQDSTFLEMPRWGGARSIAGGMRERKLHVDLPAAFVDELEQRVARPAAATLKSVFLAAHLRVLGMFTRQPEVLTGVVCDGRPEAPGGDQVRGLFLNTMPFRLQLNGGSWLSLVRQVFESEIEMLPYRRYPLATLQRRAGAERLFETTFLYINFHSLAALYDSGAISTERVYTTLSVTNYPLAAVFQKDPGTAAVRLTLVFDDSQLHRAQVEALAGSYRAVLRAMTVDPAGRYDGQTGWSEAERHQVLVEWNETRTSSLLGGSVLHLFKAQADRMPDAVALVFDGAQWTWSQLDRRSNQVARHLRALGTGPEARVGLSVERGPGMVLGMLGILKAGGAYVPLDPSYPRERLELMVDDADLRVLLTEERLLAALPASRARVVCLDRDQDRIAGESEAPLGPDPLPSSSAYVIYTSGSTGRPKGVVVSHGALANFLGSMLERPGMTREDVLLAVTSLSFDISALEIYLPLLAGARLELVSRWEAADGASLLARLVASGATVLQGTPTTWRLLLEAGWAGEGSLRALCGGEALQGALAEELVSRAVSVWNLYGPTETTVWSLTHPVRGGSDAVVPIGRPIANTSVYVLDVELRPLPAGVTGELYISGAGVARSYLGRPELTAERFLPDPYSWDGGSRMYRTGDLARFRPDGVLEFLGRIDHQVKIRGFRIELGEIESLLLRAPGVRQAIALVREDTPGDRRLVAYAVVDRETTSKDALRVLLKAQLPHYMVPTLVLLDSLPLHPNGKVNRRALPAPEQEGVAESLLAPPRNPIEEVLTSLWAELLKIARLGVHDDFFSLGGDSLLATRMMSQVRKVFGVELPLRVLFDGPTLAALAGEIARSMAANQGAAPPPLMPVSREGEVPLSFAQERLWFMDLLRPGSAIYNIPMGVRLTGALDVAVLQHSLREILRRHESLRTTFELRDGGPIQVITEAAEPALAMVDLSDLADQARKEELRNRANTEAWQPFDLVRGPLLRVHLFRLGERESVLLLVLHHIVGDAWSTGVLVREVSALYGAFLAGQPSPLPALPIQYADFAVWQRRWLQGETLDRELGYWRRQLGGPLPALALPASRRDLGESSYRGAHLRFELPPEQMARLKAFNAKERVTLFMTLLATLSVLLHQQSGATDVLVGTDIANRNRAETEGVIGFFINLLALRTDLSGTPSFRELLQRVRRVTLDAYAHQDVPFSRVVEELGGERKSSHSPLFEILFVLQNAPRSNLSLPGLEVSPFPMDEQRSRFDLALFVHEEGGGLQGRWTYRTDLFEPAVVSRLAERYLELLTVLVRDPESRLDEIRISKETSDPWTSAIDQQTQASFDKFRKAKPRALN
jgi:amino acid adenylation domain-containing protein